MNEEKKSIPVDDDLYSNDSLLKSSCPSASSGEMTGLIPFAAEDDDIYSYEEIYPYLPQNYEDIIL